MTIIFAPDYKQFEGQLIFLAGPIQGTEDWQGKAIELISKENPKMNIASPRGDYSNRQFDYNTQVDWETYHLNLAAKKGTIFFWLAKEKEHISNRAFAQTTRFEIGEWTTKYGQDKNIKLLIGIELGFSGQKYLLRRIGQNYPEIKIYSALEEMCKEVAGK